MFYFFNFIVKITEAMIPPEMRSIINLKQGKTNISQKHF